MKRKDFNELKNKELKALHDLVEALRKEEASLRLDLGMAKIKNVHGLKEKKKDIARVLTLISQKSFAKFKEAKNATS